ncbi:flagellar hook-length control protein FliK [Priestia flexa]|uniref:flagellar hook-length control protein FliK n=1 Tax=Priestia flexa TaxID=86664 RepID=UPI00248FC788|nr:flagellar hook-length control protein FliK [Priestia flexa]
MKVAMQPMLPVMNEKQNVDRTVKKEHPFLFQAMLFVELETTDNLSTNSHSISQPLNNQMMNVDDNEDLAEFLALLELHLEEGNVEKIENEEQSILFKPFVDLIQQLPTSGVKESKLKQLLSNATNLQAYLADVTLPGSAKNFVKEFQQFFQTLRELVPVESSQLKALQEKLQQPEIQSVQFSRKEMKQLIELITQKIASARDNHSLPTRQLISMETDELGKQKIPVDKATFVPGEMSKLQQLSFHVNTNLPKDMQASQVMKQVQELLVKASFQHNASQTKLVLKLFPERLGSIQIELVQRNHETVARIIASSAQTKDLLDTQLGALKQTLISQQVQVDKIDVFHTAEQWMTNGEEHQEQKQQEKRVEEKDEKDEKDETNQIFSHSLEEALINYNV